jgi:fluoroquinolone resistance protein
VAERRYGQAAPETTSEISYEDWRGQDLSGRSYTAVAFFDVDLTETKNRAASFEDCAFLDCAFNVSAHDDAAFLNCTFTRCTFFDTTFTGCKLIGTMFDRCTHGLMRVVGGDWSMVGLPGADLRQASFRGVRMREVDLVGARCAGTLFRDVDLSGAWLHHADLQGADLRGSDLSALDPATVEVRRAIIDPDQALVIVGALGLDVQPPADDGAA